MKKLILLCLGFYCATAILSCGKEGPIGEIGPKGEDGAAGAVGPAGQDGSIIYSGRTAPASNLGKNGDYYVNIANGDFFGPKTSDGWGSSFNLRGEKGDKGDTGGAGAKGDKGDTGAPGSKIHSGNGTPPTSIGAVGDYYLDKTNILLYGPKLSASNWGGGLLLGGGSANANVKSWLINGVPVFDSFNVFLPAITQNIFDNGAVLAYGRPDSEAQAPWNYFPYTFTWNAFPAQGYFVTATVYLKYFKEGRLHFETPHPPTHQLDFTNAQLSIRIVLIEGTAGIRRTGNQPDFTDLQNIYGLRD